MLEVLNKRISTNVGIIILLLVASFAGWIMIRHYQKFMELRFEQFEQIELEIFEKN